MCIYRIPLEQSVVAPRSFCYSCKTPIAGYDNIPIFSYFILRGKCRKCGASYSPRYMLVEALTGVLFMLVWMKYGLTGFTLIYWIITFGLVLGTFVDFDHMILPDRVTLGGIAFGLVVSPLYPALHGMDTWLHGLLAAVIGACLGWGILWLVGVLGKLAFKKDAMGFGDVKLLGALGALLGWKAVLFNIVISSFLGSIIGIFFIVTKQRELQSRIPYGPYIAGAAFIWIIWGDAWWQAYVDLLMPPVEGSL